MNGAKSEGNEWVLIVVCYHWTLEIKFNRDFVNYQTSKLLQFKNLRIGQRKKPYISLTQENLIENSV